MYSVFKTKNCSQKLLARDIVEITHTVWIMPWKCSYLLSFQVALQVSFSSWICCFCIMVVYFINKCVQSACAETEIFWISDGGHSIHIMSALDVEPPNSDNGGGDGERESTTIKLTGLCRRSFFFLYLRPLFVLPAIFNHLIISSTTSLETAQIGKFLEISNLSYRFHILLIVFFKKNYWPVVLHYKVIPGH